MIKKGLNCVIDKSVKFGENVTIGNNVTLYEKVTIGNNVHIWDNCVIGRRPMGVKSILSKVENELKPTYIGDDVVLGCGAVIYFDSHIGQSTLISENVVIRERCYLEGENIIGPNTFIQKDCRIGERTRIIQMSSLASGTIIGSDNFISSGFTCVSDKTFGLQGYSEMMLGPRIGNGNLIGPNVTILDNIEIENFNIIGAKSLVTKSIGSGGVYYGIPAKFIKKRSK